MFDAEDVEPTGRQKQRLEALDFISDKIMEAYREARNANESEVRDKLSTMLDFVERQRADVVRGILNGTD